MKKLWKDTLVLTVITLIAGLLLGCVYEITKDPIAAEQERAKQEAFREVFSDAEVFTAKEAVDFTAALTDYPAQLIDEVVEVGSNTGELLGYVFTVTSKEGYGGDIRFTVGIREDGTVNGISILSISETAGLGMKANTPEFKAQFAEKNVEKFVYTKTGAAAEHEIDALSGATITTNAVTNGVNAALAAFHSLKGGA